MNDWMLTYHNPGNNEPPKRGCPGNPIELPLEEADFREVGPPKDPGACLKCDVQILGCDCHLEAIAVGMNGDIQVSDLTMYGRKFDDLDIAFGEGDPFETVEIRGRNYALFLSPYRR
jgi:hypothetical protein